MMQIMLTLCRLVTVTRTLMLITAGIVVALPVEASWLCKYYTWRNDNVRYRTVLEYSTKQTRLAQQQYAPLPDKGAYAIVRLYEIQPEATEIQPCRNLMINKRLFLQRKDDPEFVLRERSEFYAEDGTLIVSNTQDLTQQLLHSGYYTAADELPIPEDAPPGSYRLVTKLLLSKKGRAKVFLLASAEARYRILPLD
jgi:adenylate kinase family enzyme